MENCNYNQVSAIEFNFCSFPSKTYKDFFGSLNQLRKSFFLKLMPIFFSPYPDLCQMLSRCQALLSFLTENLSWIIRNINHTLTNIILFVFIYHEGDAKQSVLGKIILNALNVDKSYSIKIRQILYY